MAIPGETARPDNLRSVARLSGATPVTSSILIEFAFDQLGEGRHRRFGLAPSGGELDDSTRCGGQHHQPHDRAAGDFGAVLAHQDLGVEQPRGFHKTSSGARVETALVANSRGPTGHAGRRAPIADRRLVHGSSAHRRASVSSWEATLMY